MKREMLPSEKASCMDSQKGAFKILFLSEHAQILM